MSPSGSASWTPKTETPANWVQLTPWIRVLLEKLTVSQLVKSYPAFHEKCRFTVVFKRCRHLSLTWAKGSVQVRRCPWKVVTCPVPTKRVFSLCPNTQFRGPPILGCLRQVIQYIRRYSPYLQDVYSMVVLTGNRRHHNHHHHHHISVMQLDHLLTRSGLTYPEVSSKVYLNSFCQSDSSVSLPWVICFEAFYLHVVCSLSCIPLICPKLMFFLSPLQFVHLFRNLSKCILLFFSCTYFISAAATPVHVL